jgi:D-alanyl-D-alanine carboxypeptidase/D-alanyl-D-alanine-endopeptidase (penicillin-binding protein 4)
VALERLGPTFTWKTRVARGEIRGGVLNGSLHITGGGDPRLSRERLWLLLRELRAQGIRRIAGDVVTDRSLFRLAPTTRPPSTSARCAPTTWAPTP